MESVTDSAYYDYSFDYDFYEYFNIDINKSFEKPSSEELCQNVMCILQTTAFVITTILGMIANGLVIWIAGFKIKKTVNTVWYLSLAVSDFLFCASLPFFIVNMIKNKWVFGNFMCKFAFFFWFLNWFSSIFLLVIISVDRCVVVMFPVWAQNKRTMHRALVIVLLAWIISALLSLPAAVLRKMTKQSKQCSYSYMGDVAFTAIQTCQFIFVFVIPLLIIIVCSVLITRKLKSNQIVKSNRPLKVMTALVVVFFIFWTPYHFFSMLGIDKEYARTALIGQRIGLILASASSFINPFLYALMGKDLKRKFNELLGKTNRTFEEKSQSKNTVMNITTSGDNILSSTV